MTRRVHILSRPLLETFTANWMPAPPSRRSAAVVFGTLDSLVQELTNGNWTLLVTNNTSTNQYSFKVHVTGLTSNVFSPVIITFPTNGAVSVTNNLTFTWQGPTNWSGTLQVNENFIDMNGNNFGEASASLPTGQTNWLSPVVLPDGTNTFQADYQSNVAAIVIASTPTNASQTFAGWVSTATLETYENSQFIVGTPIVNVSSGGHTLVAHYTFDDAGSLGTDSSGHGFNLSYSGGQNGGGTEATTDSKAGGGAIDFFRNLSDGNSAGYLGWSSSTPPAVLSALAGSFSISVWVNTTDSVGSQGDYAFNGAAIISADVNGIGNDIVPIALTGGQVACNVGDTTDGYDDTISSAATVNDGNWHHVVVTRNQATGERDIYIDGTMDTSDIATTNLLNDSQLAIIGAITDGSDPDPSDGFYYAGYSGKMDDLQIYSGVLSSAEITNLFNNPGTTAPNAGGGLVVHYNFDDGDNLGADTSGNGYDLDFNGGDGVTLSSDAKAGSSAANFDGGSFFSYTSTPGAVLNALASDFTLSLWIKTTQDDGNDGGLAWGGAGLVAADIPTSTDDIVPAALDGREVGINTGPDDDTLNSIADVSDGTYHHIVITRDQTTGEKQIYVDGVLDSSDFASTDLLNDPVLVAVGCAIDASQSNPADANPSQFYQGLMDDLQIYNRIVTPDEVTFLFNNPGATLTGSSSTSPPSPVDVSFQLEIDRDQDPALGNIFLAFPSFISVSPQPTTMNTVASPNGDFSASTSPSGGDSSSTIFSSLDQVLNAITNGSWTISINQGSPTQQVYSFQISVSGLDTNLLTVVKIFSPANGAVNVALNPDFHWIGASNYSSLSVDTNQGASVNLAITATNWASAPMLNYGTNRFDVNYFSNNFPGLTFTTPMDNASNSVRTWTTVVNLKVAAASVFVVGAPAPLPVHLVNSQNGGGNFHFTFQTLAGRPHTIQARTNLTTGAWIDLTNFVGDGSLRQFNFPATNPLVRFFRVNTQ